MKLRNDFCIFVISHGKPENDTYKQLKLCNCEYPIYIVIDDKDPKLNEYIKEYGKENVCIFNKVEYSKKCDMMDNFDFDKVIVYARNACYDFAEKLGYKYFLELDDDYTSFLFRFPKKKCLSVKKTGIDIIFDLYIDFYKNNSQIKILAFMQGADLDVIKPNLPKRKTMNALFCSTDRRVIFNGRINEDVNAYTRGNQLGEIFITLPVIQLCQRQTQSGNGMSETYLKYGTYTKSFYSVIQSPSCVKISILQSPTSFRIHHQINHRFCDAKIISYRFKK